MDLYQIRYFLAVAETGSFTRAAERVFVSQPTLSTGIKRLEAVLGVRLFERGARQAMLTAAGSRFLERARTIQREVNAAKTELSRSGQRHQLRLGVLRSVPAAPLARAIGDFLAGHADVAVDLAEGSAAELDRWLGQGRLHAAIDLLAKGGAAGRRARVLFRDRQALAVPAAHPLARKPSLRPADLHEQPLIVRTHCEALTAARRILATEGVRPQVVHRTTRDDWALSLVAAGLGLCLLPDSFQPPPGAVLLPVEGVDLPRTIGLVRSGTGDAEIVDAFATVAASHAWRPAETPAERLDWAH